MPRVYSSYPFNERKPYRKLMGKYGLLYYPLLQIEGLKDPCLLMRFKHVLTCMMSLMNKATF